MGLLAYVGGVLTSFGGTTTEIATKDADTQDVLEAILTELKLHSYLLAHEFGVEEDVRELRESIEKDG